MDGGSSDGGPELVQEWQKKYPHIRLISEKDRGQSDAMNKGINLAKGSIIGFLNVDDFYENDVLPKKGSKTCAYFEITEQTYL